VRLRLLRCGEDVLRTCKRKIADVIFCVRWARLCDFGGKGHDHSGSPALGDVRAHSGPGSGHGRVDPVATQRAEESERPPAAVRNLRHQPCAARAAAMGACHIGFGPGLIDENDAGGVKLALVTECIGVAHQRCQR
jgi:hypothetical protein